MWPRLSADAARRARRIRAMLRARRRSALAVALGAGIVLMVLHWWS